MVVVAPTPFRSPLWNYRLEVCPDLFSCLPPPPAADWASYLEGLLSSSEIRAGAVRQRWTQMIRLETFPVVEAEEKEVE